MKLTIVGAGSTYTPELIDGIGRRKELLSFSNIDFFDPDEKRLEILAGFARRQLSAFKMPVEVRTTTRLEEALEGADFVVSQIRVGGQKARQKDTELGLSHGVIGQETVGCGGFACALRHIPASLEIARTMEKLCPDAVLLNFTNPAGMVTQALTLHSKVKTIGICNVPWVMQKDIAHFFQVPFESVELEYFGLNHLSWVSKVKIDGKDKTADLLQNYRKLHENRYDFPEELIEALHVLPSPYLRYYYLADEVLKELKKAPKTRAQEVMDIEASLLRQYADPSLTEKPPDLMKRGGIYYGELASAAMAALVQNKPVRLILNLPNEDVFPWLPKEAIIEHPWYISMQGHSSAQDADVPQSIRSLMIQVKTYEGLAIEAALTGSWKLAYQALLVNPLVGTAGKAKAILEALMTSYPELLKQN
jgi:6-phospho-beta-glucosidase